MFMSTNIITRSLSPHQSIPSLHTGPREITHPGTRPALIPALSYSHPKQNYRSQRELHSTCGLDYYYFFFVVV